MGFPPLLNLSTRLSTAALPGQTTKMAQTLESMFQNVAYRPTVYRTGIRTVQNVLPLIKFHPQSKNVFKFIMRSSFDLNTGHISYLFPIIAVRGHHRLSVFLKTINTLHWRFSAACFDSFSLF